MNNCVIIILILMLNTEEINLSSYIMKILWSEKLKRNPFWDLLGCFGRYQGGNIAKLKLALVGQYDFYFLMTPKQSVLI